MKIFGSLGIEAIIHLVYTRATRAQAAVSKFESSRLPFDCLREADASVTLHGTHANVFLPSYCFLFFPRKLVALVQLVI